MSLGEEPGHIQDHSGRKSEFIKKSANYNTLMDEAEGKHLSAYPEMVIGLVSEA